MPAAKATSTSNSSGVKTSASGPNAKASASSTDDQGRRWTETSESKKTAGGTFVEKVLGYKDGEEEENDESGWSFVKRSTKADTSEAGSDSTSQTEGTGGGKANRAKGATASAGKGTFAGIVDGKAVASA
jgi:hypothetical protein